MGERVVPTEWWPAMLCLPYGPSMQVNHMFVLPVCLTKSQFPFFKGDFTKHLRVRYHHHVDWNRGATHIFFSLFLKFHAQTSTTHLSYILNAHLHLQAMMKNKWLSLHGSPRMRMSAIPALGTHSILHTYPGKEGIKWVVFMTLLEPLIALLMWHTLSHHFLMEKYYFSYNSV